MAMISGPSIGGMSFSAPRRMGFAGFFGDVEDAYDETAVAAASVGDTDGRAVDVYDDLRASRNSYSEGALAQANTAASGPNYTAILDGAGRIVGSILANNTKFSASNATPTYAMRPPSALPSWVLPVGALALGGIVVASVLSRR